MGRSELFVGFGVACQVLFGVLWVEAGIVQKYQNGEQVTGKLTIISIHKRLTI